MSYYKYCICSKLIILYRHRIPKIKNYNDKQILDTPPPIKLSSICVNTNQIGNAPFGPEVYVICLVFLYRHRIKTILLWLSATQQKKNRNWLTDSCIAYEWFQFSRYYLPRNMTYQRIFDKSSTRMTLVESAYPCEAHNCTLVFLYLVIRNSKSKKDRHHNDQKKMVKTSNGWQNTTQRPKVKQQKLHQKPDWNQLPWCLSSSSTSSIHCVTVRRHAYPCEAHNCTLVFLYLCSWLNFALLYVITFSFSYWNVRNNVRVKTLFGSSLLL
jgi:hypothetical protein